MEFISDSPHSDEEMIELSRMGRLLRGSQFPTRLAKQGITAEIITSKNGEKCRFLTVEI